ncbi:MAG: uroporphyrinogen-III C-methyltransferase, partial [Elusimicrobia bacterium]|nr:uroporphyrinogen-III C-methyltransferase [Elusimicrobiota bacterium]
MKRVLLFLPLAAALGLGGCVATQQDMLDLESQTDSLKQQVAQLDKTISSLQANQADLSVRMQSLHEDLSSYTETIKENQDQMTRLSSKLDDLSAGVESRVAQIGATLSSQQLKSLEQQRAAAEQAAKAAAESTAPSDLFNTADVRLNVKDYDLAAKGFEEYLRKYPHGALVDVATYKLGQAYFRQG